MQGTHLDDVPTSTTTAAPDSGSGSALPAGAAPTTSRRRILRRAALALVAVAAVVPFWVATMRQPVMTMEESALLVYPDLLADGSWPNHDFEYVYGPGDLWVLTGVYAITGPSLLALRTVGVLYNVLAAIAIAGIAWRVDRRVAVAAGVACWFLLVPVGGSYPSVGAMALTLSAVWAAMAAEASPRRTGLVVAAGLAAGGALSFRPDFAPAVILGCAPLWSAPSLRGRWRALVVGAAVGLIPLGSHVAVVGPGTAWQGMVADPVFRHSPGRRLPFPPSLSEAPDFFTRIAQATGAPTYAPWSLSTQVAILVWTAVAVCVGLVALVTVTWLRQGGVPRSAVAIGGFAVGALPYAIQRADAAHAGLVLACVGPLVPVAIAILQGNPSLAMREAAGASLAGVAPGDLTALSRRSVATRLAPWLAAAGVVAIGVGGVPAIVARPAAERYVDAVDRPAILVVEGGEGRVLPMPPDLGAEVQAVVDAVRGRSDPGDRVVIAPRDLRRTNYGETYLYYLLPELVPGTYHLEMNPGTANGQTSRLPGDLRRADLVVLSSRYDAWSEANRSAEPGSSTAAEMVASDFEVVDEVGPYTILVPEQ